MPYPRRDPDTAGGFRSPDAPQLQGRTPTEAESQRRRRTGHRAKRPGARDLWWTETRNGIPFRPYRYGGTGADAFTGEVVE
jgi:hypothetical protein